MKSLFNMQKRAQKTPLFLCSRKYKHPVKLLILAYSVLFSYIIFRLFVKILFTGPESITDTRLYRFDTNLLI